MLFSSTVFLFGFLPLCLVLHLVCGRRLRNLVLLVASLFFYAWGETFLLGLMLVSIGANWLAGLGVSRATDDASKRRVVAAAVVFDIGLLVAFKYADWLWTTFAGPEALPLGRLLFERDGLASSVLVDDVGGIRLPIGISFFTFQALSYVVDVYRRDAEPQRNPLDFALYVSLFPQLVAGPIVRYRDVAEQLRARLVGLDGFAYGVRRFVIGLGKKVLIANVVAGVADQAFAAAPGDLSAPVAWLGIVCYALQIYFDFSGYSDMAIGLGLLLGFRFPSNFLSPYRSASVTETWPRWHISLSSWFRDYLYIPLGGNRFGRGRTYLNLLLVFLLCGLWHGASWSFVVWGLYHGAFLVIERVGPGAVIARAPAPLRHGYVLLVVLVGWVFFRAPDATHALEYLATLVGAGAATSPLRADLLVDPAVRLALVAGVVGSVPWLPWLGRRREGATGGGARPTLRFMTETASLAGLAAILLLCGLRLSAGTYDPFIYFRF